MAKAELEALLNAQRDAEQWTEVCETLGRLANIAATPAARAAALCARATVQEERLMDLNAAAESLRAALAATPDDREALNTLAALYKRIAHWMELAPILERLAELALAADPPDKVEAARKLTELGWVYRTQLGDLDRADEIFARATALA